MNFSSIQTTAAAAVDADASGVHLFSTETEKKDEGNILLSSLSLSLSCNILIYPKRLLFCDIYIVVFLRENSLIR